MRTLIADKFEELGLRGLEEIGCDVSFQPDLKEEGLVKAINQFQPDVLIVRSTAVTAAMLDADLSSLSFAPAPGTTP
ncbi:MAG: hypothetical protein WKF84_25545 [Pyrinomonadaceae bacterium]